MSCTVLLFVYRLFDDPTLKMFISLIRPQKVNYMFLRHRPRHFQPPRIKNFYCIPTDKCEKSSTHSELTVQSGRHLPCFWLVGWLNSGAPALAIRHHLLKVGIFTEHRRNIVFIHKR